MKKLVLTSVLLVLFVHASVATALECRNAPEAAGACYYFPWQNVPQPPNHGQLPTAEDLPESVVDWTLKGSLSVNRLGEAEYTLPIELPAGKPLVTPSLALEYNSRGPTGMLGKRWALVGIPKVNACNGGIVRSNEVLSDARDMGFYHLWGTEDETIRSVNIDTSGKRARAQGSLEALCMDSRPLVPATEVESDHGEGLKKQYRFVPDDGSWFEAETDYDSGGALIGHYLKHYERSGRIAHFRKSSDKVWRLEYVTHRGSELSIRYFYTDDGRPERITYNRGYTATHVRFHYSRGQCNGDEACEFESVLVNIEVKVGGGANEPTDGAFDYIYHLRYDSTSPSKTSRLVGIKACSASLHRQCSDETTFEWEGEIWRPEEDVFEFERIRSHRLHVEKKGSAGENGPEIQPLGTPVYYADFDGDGATDILAIHNYQPLQSEEFKGNRWVVYRAKDNFTVPTGVSSSNQRKLTGLYENNYYCRLCEVSCVSWFRWCPPEQVWNPRNNIKLLDYDGDGLMDFVRQESTSDFPNGTRHHTWVVHRAKLNERTGRLFFERLETPATKAAQLYGSFEYIPFSWQPAGAAPYWNVGLRLTPFERTFFTDFNGDGAPDILTCDATFIERPFGYGNDRYDEMRHRIHPRNHEGPYTWQYRLNSHVGFGKLYDTGVACDRSANEVKNAWSIVDVNGDGAFDLLQREPDGTVTAIKWDGVDQVLVSKPILPPPPAHSDYRDFWLDMDGDGLTDLLRVESTGDDIDIAKSTARFSLYINNGGGFYNARGVTRDAYLKLQLNGLDVDYWTGESRVLDLDSDGSDEMLVQIADHCDLSLEPEIVRATGGGLSFKTVHQDCTHRGGAQRSGLWHALKFDRSSRRLQLIKTSIPSYKNNHEVYEDLDGETKGRAYGEWRHFQRPGVLSKSNGERELAFFKPLDDECRLAKRTSDHSTPRLYFLYEKCRFLLQRYALPTARHRIIEVREGDSVATYTIEHDDDGSNVFQSRVGYESSNQLQYLKKIRGGVSRIQKYNGPFERPMESLYSYRDFVADPYTGSLLGASVVQIKESAGGRVFTNRNLRYDDRPFGKDPLEKVRVFSSQPDLIIVDTYLEHFTNGTPSITGVVEGTRARRTTIKNDFQVSFTNGRLVGQITKTSESTEHGNLVNIGPDVSYDILDCSGTGVDSRPRWKSCEIGEIPHIYDAKLVRDSSVEREYDDYGNVSKRTVRNGEHNTLVTDITHLNDDTSGLFGLPVNVTMTHDVKTMTPQGWATDSATRSVDLSYNSLGQLESQTYVSADGTIERRFLQYDSAGNPISLTEESRGQTRTTNWTYDNVGMWLLAETGPLGFRTSYTRNRLGKATSIIDAADTVVVTRSYDWLGRVVGELFADGTATQVFRVAVVGPNDITYAGTHVSDSRGRESGAVRDRLGRPVLETEKSDDGKVKWEYGYDAFNRLAWTTEPVPRHVSRRFSTKFGYRLDGFLETITRPDQRSESYMEDFEMGHVDGPRRVVSFRDSLNREHRHEFRADGQLARSSNPLLNLGYTETTQEHSYGAFGRYLGYSDEQGNWTKNDVDEWGILRSTEDPTRGIRFFEFGPFGYLASVTHSNGDVVAFERDLAGRLTGKFSPEREVYYGYDNLYPGRLDYELSTDGKRVDRQYDSLGRVRSESYHVANQTFRYDFSYNSHGQVESVTYPTDVNGRRPTVDNVYSGSTGTLVGTSGFINHSVDVDYRGRITERLLPNGIVQHFEYDPAMGWLTDIQTRLNQTSVQHLRYHRDAASNIVSKEEVLRGLETVYGYDMLDRLVSFGVCETGSNNCSSAQSLSYDSVGNITSMPGAGSYSYPNPAKPYNLDSTGGGNVDPPMQFDSDARGRSVHHNEWMIEWMSFDKPRRLTSPDSDAIDYGYFPDATKASRTTVDSDGNQTETFYAGRGFERRIDENGVVEDIYHLEAHGLPLADVHVTVGDETTVYFQVDHLGGVLSESDNSGAIADREYSPFGRPLEPTTGSVSNAPLTHSTGFTGHTHEQTFGLELIDMGGRFYDPRIGRFLSPDPFTSPTLTQFSNPFSYVLNNPLNLTDPSGYQPHPGIRRSMDSDPPPPPERDTGPGFFESLADLIASTFSELGSGSGSGASRQNPAQSHQFHGLGAMGGTLHGAGVPASLPNLTSQDSRHQALYANGQGEFSVAGSLSSFGAGAFEQASSLLASVTPAYLAVAFPPAHLYLMGSLVAEGIGAIASDPVGSTLRFMNELKDSVLPFYASGNRFADAASRMDGNGMSHAIGEMTIEGVAILGGVRLAKAFGATCFAEGTPVVMCDGTTKPIEEVEIGDMVAAASDREGELRCQPVTETLVHESRTRTLHFEDGQLLETTPEHPFWTDEGWKEAGRLRGGDRVFTLANGWVQLAGGTWSTEPEPTYNISVAEFHTYFVGESGIWVHNKWLGQDATKKWRQGILGLWRKRCSFTEDTPVLMCDGTLRPIEQVNEGDFVLARDETTGELGCKEVVDPYANPDRSIILVELAHPDGNVEVIETTDNHPFFVTDKGWTRVDALGVGDEVPSSDGRFLVVVGLTWTDRIETVYNFGVEGFHTYFVGESGAWVHNCFSPKEQRIAKYLEGLGMKVKSNPLEGVEGAGRQGDAIVNGVKHEFKSLDPGAGSGTIRNTVGRSTARGGQARNIVLDARGSGLSESAAQRGIWRAHGANKGKVDHISVIGDDFFIGYGPK